MDFWNTIRGHHLADVLIRCLPQLAERKSEQFTQRGKLEEFEMILHHYISETTRYVNHQVIGEEVIIIFEREI